MRRQETRSPPIGWARKSAAPEEFNAACRPEAANDVISGVFVRLTVPDNDVKFSDPRLNRSPIIRSEVVGGSFTKVFW